VRERTALAEAAFKEKELQLNRIARGLTVGELAVSIAHEINQPLAAIVTNAEAALRWLAADPPDINEARDTLANIVDDGNRAGNVIARIRSMLRKEAPKVAELNIKEAIDEALLLARPALQRSGV